MSQRHYRYPSPSGSILVLTPDADYGLHHGCEPTGTSILEGSTAFVVMVEDDGGNRLVQNVVCMALHGTTVWKTTILKLT
jgi:hypothetical protein